VRLKFHCPHIFGLFVVIAALFAPPRVLATDQIADVPAWLQTHVGEGENRIAQLVLQRARVLYRRKTSEGVVKNPCYFAMDATRPHNDGELGRRFYIVCEPKRWFRAIPAGHGAGRNLKGIADFANGRRCAKNFGNAEDSKLTAGGAYVTGETKSSFKGYYRVSGKRDVALVRTFIQFDGEGETANARQRAIGGHEAVTLKNLCLRKKANSPFANQEGYVPFGMQANYAGGRSEGCTSWSSSDARQILALVKNHPTTLYIYPSAADVDAIAQLVASGRSRSHDELYWNASCLKEIGAPKFWSQEALEPLLAQYGRDHPASPPRPLPNCNKP